MSGPMERGFVSGPIDSGPIEKAREQLPIENIVKSKKRRRWIDIFKKVISSTIARGHKPAAAPVKGGVNVCKSGGCIHLKDGDGDNEYFKERKNLQWAQGKAGEDRVQVVISEDHGWVFVGIYDGFNGPDATEYLISNLYSAVHEELKGLKSAAEGNQSQATNFDEENEMFSDLDSNSKRKSSKNKSDGTAVTNHSDVLKAVSEALRKTEDAYLEIADKLVKNNPELALMGSCVLVMLMKGEDVYLMNVGDSRAVLAQEADQVDHLGPRKVHQDLKRINEEILSNHNFYFGVASGGLSNLISLQLTTDHSTYVEEVIYLLFSNMIFF